MQISVSGLSKLHFLFIKKQINRHPKNDFSEYNPLLTSGLVYSYLLDEFISSLGGFGECFHINCLWLYSSAPDKKGKRDHLGIILHITALNCML